MNVTQTSSEGLKREFKVTVPAGHIDSLIQARLEEVGRTARVPGFRPGKIPMAMLRKKYGQSILGEVIERAVDGGVKKALNDNNLRPVLRPDVKITSYDEGTDLEFTIALETLPDIELIDMKQVKIEKPVAEVDEADVEKSLTAMAENRATPEPISEDRPAKAGDIVVIDFEGKLDGVPFEGGQGKAYELKLGSGTFIPGFEDQLIGAKIGQKVVVKVSFPENYGKDDLAGKPAEFDVVVDGIRETIPLAIDDELAKLFGKETLDELKQAIRDNIAQDYAKVSRVRAKQQLLDQLAEKVSFIVPQSLVDYEFDAIWKNIEQAKAADQLDEEDKAKSDDQLKEEYRKIAERRVRLGLILADVAQKNNLSVTQTDVTQAILEEVRRYPGQEQAVFQYYLKNEQARESLRAPILEEKSVDFLLELADISEKIVSLEELLKDPTEAKA